MKFTVTKPVEIDIAFVEVILPVRYGEEDIPNNFPLRTCDEWHAIIDIKTGVIHDWPVGREGKLEMKVCDEGQYTLLDSDRKEVAWIHDYVPHGVIPGSYGDYVKLTIDCKGRITNWPKKPDVSEFFMQEG